MDEIFVFFLILNDSVLSAGRHDRKRKILIAQGRNLLNANEKRDIRLAR